MLTDEQQITVTVLEQALNESIRINSGRTDLALSGGRVFLSDRYFGGTDRVNSVSGGDILNTTDDNLYRSGRCSPAFSYNIPMTNATYRVVLHFAETWYGAPGRGPAGAGKRMFNVDIEGTRKLTNYDIIPRPH